MTTSTQPPTQPKKETRINPRDMIGGTFEDIFETVTGRAVLEQQPGFPSTGSIEFKSMEVQVGQITRDVLQIHREQSIKPSVDQKREEMNKLLGFNLAYLEPMDSQGNSREYYESEAGRKLNSQMEEKELKAKREEMKSQGTNKKPATATVGPTVNLNTTFEDRNADKPG